MNNNLSARFPRFKRNLKLEEFYEDVRERNNRDILRQNYRKRKFTIKNYIQIGIIVMLLVLLPYTVLQTQIVQNFIGKASTVGQEVKIFLFPTEIKESLGKSFAVSPKVVLQSPKKISSLLLSINFDKNYLKVTKVQNGNLGNHMIYLKSSQLSVANEKGVLKILTGADGETTAPSGVVNLSQITFEVLTEHESKIKINTSESQVVFTDQTVGEISTDNGVSVNSKQAPTPTPTRTVTPTRTLTPTVASTSTPTVTPALSLPSHIPAQIPTITTIVNTPTPTPVITEPVNPSITESATQATPTVLIASPTP